MPTQSLSDSERIVQAVKKVLPGVVSIAMIKKLKQVAKSKKNRIKVGGGTGFIIDQQGIILTNRHVIEEPKADYMVILQDGQKVKPKVLAIDPVRDIAILKISLPKKSKKLASVKLGDSTKLNLGETVIAIGNALGIFKNTVSTGVISGLSRQIQAQGETSNESTRLRGLIQTDAAINPGNSGGPLINLKGEAIGINAAMVFGAENIGFALPSNSAKKALEELKEFGRIRQPFLGVRYLPITASVKHDFDLPVSAGALVIAEPDISLAASTKESVVPKSPADKAGMKEADIIVAINNKKISPELSVADILQDCEIGQKLCLKVLRKGKQKTLKTTLAEKKKK